MKRASLYFDLPGKVSVHQELIPELAENEVLVKTVASAISAGTEMLFYRGEAPDDLPTDEIIPALKQQQTYPLKYGYAAVGKVIKVGAAVASAWQGKTVFAFNPHENYFISAVEQLIEIPNNIAPDAAVFLANMETALNFVDDAEPQAGERVVVLGQGVVGLLTTALLSKHSLKSLITLDNYPARRSVALQMGATASVDPADYHGWKEIDRLLEKASFYDGAELTFELSGNPKALNQALSLTGYKGRVIIGSWYGKRPVELDLGGRFHRSRIKLIGSQVSNVSTGFLEQEDKIRRLLLALEKIKEIKPESLITHRFALAEAHKAYELLAERPESAVQVLFTYE